MKLLKILIVLLFLLPSTIKDENVYKLVFFDDFHGNSLDLNRWNIEIGPRNSAVNSADSIIINNGLKIHSFTKNNQYYTGIINTRNKFSLNQGIIEAKVKFDDVPGSWSDIWIFNDNVSKDEENPEVNGYELDLFEHRVYDYNNDFIGNKVNYATHFNGYAHFHDGNYFVTKDLNLINGWHLFKIILEIGYCDFYIDGKMIEKFQLPKTSAKMFIVISTELSNHQYNWTAKLPERIDNNTICVDYIKVWQN